MNYLNKFLDSPFWKLTIISIKMKKKIKESTQSETEDQVCTVFTQFSYHINVT